MSAFNPSGTTHSRTIPTSQDTAIATLAGMKESAEWAGLFDSEESKSKGPCVMYHENGKLAYRGQHTWERIKIKHPSLNYFVDQYLGKIGPKTYAHFAEACKCGKRINSSELV